MNAALCYVGFSVSELTEHAPFAWHLIPAGAGHSCLLALVALAFARGSRGRSKPIKVLAVLGAGWVGGYTSSLLLSASLRGSWPVWDWPLGEGYLGLTIFPFAFFGLVGLFFCLWLSLVAPRHERLMEHVAGAGVAGICGSLLFWVAFGDQWYVGLVHGVIWGVLVGIATVSSSPPTESGREQVV